LGKELFLQINTVFPPLKKKLSCPDVYSLLAALENPRFTGIFFEIFRKKVVN
jgi:hypothetical protein